MAIVKFVTARCPMNNIFPYVMNREKTDGGILVSGIHCMPETALDEFRFIKNKFGKTDGRQYYHMREHYVNEFIAKAKEYIEIPKLTPELLRVFIRKIEVMEKTEKYSRTCGNTIIIHYTFEYPRQCAAITTNNVKTA